MADGRGWFVVLPDCASASAVAGVLSAQEATITIEHASGRPWLIGHWACGEMNLAIAGPTRLAVFGACSVNVESLLRRCRNVRDLDRVAGAVRGSTHLALSVDGDVRVQGTISGLRRVWVARVGGITIGSDRSDVLAGVVGADVDEEGLAARLLEPAIPHPVAARSVWRGVRGVPVDSALLLGHDGRAELRRWWTPPAPERSLAAGAERFAEALTGAVDARTEAGGTVSADLSGGLDSTPLCFLAARRADLVGITFAGRGAGHDDSTWAARAVTHLPQARHVTLAAGELPACHTGLLTAGEGLDEPALGGRGRAPSAEISRRMVEAGARLHLSGEGGDQVVQAPRSYVHATVRSHPAVGVSHLRAWAALSRWPLAATLRAAAENRPYGRWLARMAGDLSPLVTSREPQLGWQSRAGLPPWVTPDGVAAVRDLLRRAADEVEPLAATRGQHEALLSVQSAARICRAMSRWSTALPLHHPFLDDKVIEASLAVRLHERSSPFEVKPLTVAAMRGIVPAELLARRTKGEFSADVHAGLTANRAELAEVLDDPILGRMGIVDAAALRRAALGLYPPRLSLAALEATLAVETWLRAPARTQTTPTEGHPT